TGAILHVDGVDVGIRAQPEGHRQDVAAVGGAGGLIIERVVDAVDLLLDRLRHSRFDHLGIGARIAGVERNLRRGGVWKLCDGNREKGEGAGKRDDDGDDDGGPRPPPGNAGQHLAARSPKLMGAGPQDRRAPPPTSGGGGGGGGWREWLLMLSAPSLSLPRKRGRERCGSAGRMSRFMALN